MANIVVTGSSKGIGFGLVREFKARGHHVTVTGRSQTSIDDALGRLEGTGDGRAIGVPCDIADRDTVEAVYDRTSGAFGSVDIWINNAGLAATTHPAHLVPVADVETMVRTNVLGTIWGSQVALAGMRAAGGTGRIFNMLGGGYDGTIIPNMSLYSATKSAVHTLTKYMVAESTDTDILIGTISPGLVISDNMITQAMKLPAEVRAMQCRILNILADEVETVSPFIVDGVLGADKTGAHIQWLTKSKAGLRFLTARFGKPRDICSKYGL